MHCFITLMLKHLVVMLQIKWKLIFWSPMTIQDRQLLKYISDSATVFSSDSQSHGGEPEVRGFVTELRDFGILCSVQMDGKNHKRPLFPWSFLEKPVNAFDSEFVRTFITTFRRISTLHSKSVATEFEKNAIKYFSFKEFFKMPHGCLVTGC